MPFTYKRLEDLQHGARDYALLYEGKTVGRCYGRHDGRWHWTITHQAPLRTIDGPSAKGIAETFQHALAQFKIAYTRERERNGVPLPKHRE